MDYVDREKYFIEDEKNMLVRPRYDEDLELNAKFEVCGACDGRGKHANHLGSFAANEWNQLDWETREDYLHGAYDMICEICKGKRVILIPDENNNSEADLKRWEVAMQEEYSYRAERLAEMRMGC